MSMYHGVQCVCDRCGRTQFFNTSISHLKGFHMLENNDTDESVCLCNACYSLMQSVSRMLIDGKSVHIEALEK